MPGVLIAWAMAMSVFRTPAISLICRYAFASELPIAMSFLTLVGGFIGALRPISQDFLLSLGAQLTFTIVSIVLLIAYSHERREWSDDNRVTINGLYPDDI